MSTSWLPRALGESRARGFLGPGELEAQIEHARGFARSWESASATPPSTFLDLGSGGGLPGLVLLDQWRCHGVLLDSMQKRTAFLKEVLGWPDAPSHAEIITGRSEEVARVARFDGAFPLVTARSFGSPAVVAECAARFLLIGGLLIVSEPPERAEGDRWSEKGLDVLGLEKVAVVRDAAGYQVIRKVRETPAAYPRKVGTPKKKPLF